MATCAKANSLEEERRKMQPRATHAKKCQALEGTEEDSAPMLSLLQL